ncbi:thioesterase-like superfamily-domain-containing protein [Mariannaea sp. PMI_226]|nr:thioesterase-like superfamily-domain-containing protein [Mariannaea sp. PMI_226]
MAANIAEQVAIEQLEPGEYVSKHLPIRMGNSMPIAYGGCAMAIAVNAACSTVASNMSLYSVLGNFHGPASTEQKLYCTVTKTRDTRSFATRRVQVKQKQRDGQFRACLELIADFHIIEPSLLTYSASPKSTWPRVDDCPTIESHAEKLRASGRVTEAEHQTFVRTLGMLGTFFEGKYCINGISGQNLAGVGKHIQTTQDDRHITAKTSAEWQKAKGRLSSAAENMAAMAFLMDGALSFLPLTHNHLWLEDAAACSSLDFALRIFTPDVNMESWHIKERTTSRAGYGRTFSEGNLWDDKGNLVASMTQQSILRMQQGFPTANL